MEYVYLVCAIVGSTLIVCQFVMTLLGIGGGDHDIGGHDVHVGGDVTGAHEVGHGAEPSWFFSVLTFRTLTAAIAFFGLAGMGGLGASLDPVPSLALALAAGFVALFLVAYLMNLISKLNLDGTVRIERSVGARGTVYLTIPGNRSGMGKVHISHNNRLLEYNAVTAQNSLTTGTKIVVVGVISPDTVEVASSLET